MCEEPGRLLLRPDERAGRARRQPQGRRLARARRSASKHFVQFITLDQEDRPRPDIARAWVETLVDGDPQGGPRHLITVGPGGLEPGPPGLTSGLRPGEGRRPTLDFLCVHLYPETGKVDEAIEDAQGLRVGKPVVIEETFPLDVRAEEFETFLDGRRRTPPAGSASTGASRPRS